MADENESQAPERKATLHGTWLLVPEGRRQCPGWELSEALIIDSITAIYLPGRDEWVRPLAESVAAEPRVTSMARARGGWRRDKRTTGSSFIAGDRHRKMCCAVKPLANLVEMNAAGCRSVAAFPARNVPRPPVSPRPSGGVAAAAVEMRSDLEATPSAVAEPLSRR